jgi:sporulation protein YlmC with PRC-barrel domain
MIQIVQNVLRVISWIRSCKMIVFNVKPHVEIVLLQKTAQHVILQASNGTTLKIPAHNVQKVNS